MKPWAPLFVFFDQLQKELFMQLKKSKKLYHVELEFPNGLTRQVKVRANSRSVAENRALKFHPNAKGVKRNA